MLESIIPLWVRKLGKYYDAIRYGVNDPYIKWKMFDRFRLVKFHNIHQGKSCFIIGNGPSLNKTDLLLLKKHYTFGLNKIYLHKDFKKINISYYVAVNNFVIEQSKKQLKQFRLPCFLPVDRLHGLKQDNIFPIKTTGPTHVFSPTLLTTLYEGATVTYVAIQIAFYMGFKTVYLVGVDHRFTYSGKPHETQVLEGKDLNHFHSSYFKNQKWQLPDLVESEYAYSTAKRVFEMNGRKIFDATVDGQLKIFEKLPFTQAVNIASN